MLTYLFAIIGWHITHYIGFIKRDCRGKELNWINEQNNPAAACRETTLFRCMSVVYCNTLYIKWILLVESLDADSLADCKISIPSKTVRFRYMYWRSTQCASALCTRFRLHCRYKLQNETKFNVSLPIDAESSKNFAKRNVFISPENMHFCDYYLIKQKIKASIILGFYPTKIQKNGTKITQHHKRNKTKRSCV